MFGNKSSKDMKLIQPLVDKVKAAYPEIKALSNDELRARTKELQKYVQDSANEQKAKIAELKAKIEETPIDERESIFNAIDKLEKEVLDQYEKALDEIMPVAFSIVKDTARRFAENEETVVTATDFDRELAENPKNDFITIDGDKAIYHNHWTAGGNDLKWEMVHYDVQIFGGIVLHQGKIAEMATGEGKTLVATLPVFLNALTGNGVHVVTVNDYLAKRDSEWMGPLYMFNGLSVDCIDKHRPNSPERRKAYMADITFGTNNEFGFDYLRDNMALSPDDLVQRKHNYAIVDEVDSVLIDDARTPLIISGPIAKGETRCSRNISRSWSVSLTFSANSPHSTSQRPSSSSPRVRRLTTRRSWRKASSLSIVHTRPCLRTSRSSSTSLRKVSRLACSRQRSTIWRTTTAACPRQLSRSSSL